MYEADSDGLCFPLARSLRKESEKPGSNPSSTLYERAPRDFDFCPFSADDRNRPEMQHGRRAATLFGPLGRCGATQGLAGKGRGLSEGRSPEFRSPPPAPSSAGNRRSRHRPRVAFLFGYFLLGNARRKYARASGAEPAPNQIQQPIGTDKTPNPVPASPFSGGGTKAPACCGRPRKNTKNQMESRPISRVLFPPCGVRQSFL